MENTVVASGFVYKWTNQINGKWYIGSHKGTIGDGYRHTSKILALAEEKYGLENFKREILYTGEDYRNVEAEYLVECDAANNTQSYNRCNIVAPFPFSKEVEEKRIPGIKKGWDEFKKDEERYEARNKALSDFHSNRPYEEPLKGKTYEEIHGEEKAQELRKKRGEQQKKRLTGRTWEEIYGPEKAAEMKKAAKERMKGNKRGFKSKIT